ncbi:hypothetical protein BDY21DRAFT_289964 [Lineolata rhizophorae]|uniref:Glucose-methanol-choline oxidoreductase N-terminal domain-containing protein n=1 Tax=Lineolata rhizophorae TaxID=578093 RepID=A0A6A6NTB8_9PEZI|nr:hypothetical protein BDY21DRAFT_289964 [Lineolata rhizophorae]
MPLSAYQAREKRQALELADSYDYVIVGGGTAGLTIADRLTEDPDVSVLVIEYGYFDTSEAQLSNQATGGFNPRFTYNITSQPQEQLDGRQFPVGAGCIVGGSSGVNGMMFDRGSAEDYDNFARAGYEDSDWTWEGLLPYFKKSVKFWPMPEDRAETYGFTMDIDAAYGGDGPIWASMPPWQWPAQQIQWDAWKDIPGVEFPAEGAAGVAGVFWFPSSVDPRTWTRSFARFGYYEEVMPRENYHIITGHQVVRVNLDNSSTPLATGVTIKPREVNSTTFEVKADKEVIVSAGSPHTPQVLQLSGIGPREWIEALGVEVRVELPGVGMNYQDHPMVNMLFNCERTLPSSPSQLTMFTNSSFRAEAQRMFEEDGDGPLTIGVGNSGAFLGLPVVSPDRYEDIAAALEAQDPADFLPPGTHETVLAGARRQHEVLAASYRSPAAAVYELPFVGGGGASIIALKAASRGTVRVDPEDPLGDPLIDWRALSNPLDATVMVEMVKLTRRWMGGPTMARLGPVEFSPGPDVQTDEEIEEWVRSTYNPQLYHPVGVSAMAPRELGGVVSDELFVHGTRGLRVVDASIMPLVPGTHTSSTVYAIAEKVSDGRKF